MHTIKSIVVDDELFGREQVKSQLKKYFPQINVVAEAANGKEAIQLIHFHKPDLVF
ncbi:MAG: response regulator [Bacteroidetes bacterium]|nr:response regulator [Bacteroidota bacterium]